MAINIDSLGHARSAAIAVAIGIALAFSLLAIVTFEQFAGENTQYAIFAIPQGGMRYVQITKSIATSESNRLELILGQPTVTQTETALELEVQTSFLNERRVHGLDFSIYSQVPNQHPVALIVDCLTPDDSHREGFNSTVVTAKWKRAFLYPFDELDVRYELRSEDLPRWTEISLYNRTDSFIFDVPPSVQAGSDIITISATLRRSYMEMIGFVVLLAISLTYVLFVSTAVKGRVFLFLNWLPFLVAVYMGQRLILQNQPLGISAVDIPLFILALLIVTVSTVRAKHDFAPPYSLFVSYRRTDSRHASDRIFSSLECIFPKGSIFKDVNSMELGEDIDLRIVNTIEQVKVVLVVIGQVWLGDNSDGTTRAIDRKKDYPRREVEIALEKGRTLIPLLVDNASMPDKDSLPDSIKELSTLVGRDIRSNPGFRQDMKELTAELRKIA